MWCFLYVVKVTKLEKKMLIIILNLNVEANAASGIGKNNASLTIFVTPFLIGHIKIHLKYEGLFSFLRMAVNFGNIYIFTAVKYAKYCIMCS